MKNPPLCLCWTLVHDTSTLAWLPPFSLLGGLLSSSWSHRPLRSFYSKSDWLSHSTRDQLFKSFWFIEVPKLHEKCLTLRRARISATSRYSWRYLSASNKLLFRFLSKAGNWGQAQLQEPVFRGEFVKLCVQSDLFPIQIFFLSCKPGILLLCLLNLTYQVSSVQLLGTI